MCWGSKNLTSGAHLFEAAGLGGGHSGVGHCAFGRSDRRRVGNTGISWEVNGISWEYYGILMG